MNVQTEYYIRLLLLLVQCGILVCRGITEKEFAGTGLDMFLKPHEPKLKKKLLRSQYLMLFPKTGNSDVEDLDLSLLTILLLDIFTLSTTEIQYVRVIKDTRNKLSHKATASLTEADYTTMKQDLENALNNLSLSLDVKIQRECSQLIKKFTNEPLDESTALKYVKDLRNEDELLQDFEGMLEKQSEVILQEINTSESRLHDTLSGMEERLSSEIKKMYIGYSLDDHTYMKFPDTLPSCENCNNGDRCKASVIFCEDCTKFLCSECSVSIHNRKETHRRQEIVKGKPIKIDAKGYDMCFEHRKNLAYICESDNELCCERCLNEKHQDCKTITNISKTVFEPKINPSMEIPQLQNETSLLSLWLSSIESDINENVENISSRLDECRKILLEMFDTEAQKIRENVAVMKRHSMNEIKSKRKSCKDLGNKTELAKLPLINMSKSGTVCQKRIAQYRMEQFIDTFKSLKDMNIISLSSSHFNLPDHLLQQPASLSQYHVNIPEARPVLLHQISQIAIKKSKEDNRVHLYTGLDFFPDGKLAVIDNKNMKLLVYDGEELHHLGSYALPYHPLDMVVLSEEEVAITKGDEIIFLNVSKSNKIAVVGSLEVNSCDSICMMDDGNFGVGTCDRTKPAFIVSLTGEEKDFNLDFSYKKYKCSDRIYSTYLRYSNKVVISDRHTDTVTIYDISTNTSIIVKDNRIKDPRGMAVGPFDCIFVCSNQTGSIVQISPNGDIVANHNINMNNPFKICFSKDKTRLAVSNNIFKNSLKVFNVNICRN